MYGENNIRECAKLSAVDSAAVSAFTLINISVSSSSYLEILAYKSLFKRIRTGRYQLGSKMHLFFSLDNR
ncbi:hypothetical protein RRG08_018111 [Elysia crispata]|uniref:Uncharacterized protein n=1 Tax=Elysia crispata TaxID=231223 RepID=A0AAE0ZD43_9GAST|nr:hypothetical protein RRG08_018111 [Elysia crispata]